MKTKEIKKIFESEAVMRISILLISFITTLIIISSCDNSPTGPEEPPPGRRDYVWEVDTINLNSLTTFGDIWGSSYNDVWMGGIIGSVLDRLWHFDGEGWTKYEIFNDIAPSTLFEPLDILGFGNNDVWIATTFSNIFHFDGMSWSEYGPYEVEGYDEIFFVSLWGTKPNKIYTSGLAVNRTSSDQRGIIMEYDGSDWKFVKMSNTSDYIFGVRIDKKTNHFIATGTDFTTVPRKTTLYRLVGEELKPFYSSEYKLDLFDINGTIYVPENQKIYKYDNENLVLWKDFTNSSYWRSSIYGRSKNDFFTINHDGLGHYNGSDLITIYPTDLRIFEMYVGENYIFVILKDLTNEQSVNQFQILRGILK